MANITLRQLRYFEALTHHQHFGRAAEASAISQPALSVQIKELEEAFGSQLFERTARQVRLTPFGEEIATRIRDVLTRVDQLEDFARASQGRLTGRFRIGIIPTIAPYLLPSLIQDLGQSHPGLELQVRETVTPRLVQELMQGKLDTAIVALPVSEPGLDEVPLFHEPFVLVRPKADAGSAVPTVDELRHMRLLLLEEGHCLRDQSLSFCNATPSIRRDTLDGSSLSTLVQMVGAGIGVTMIPQMAVEIETRAASVCCAAFQAPQPGRTVGMIWRERSPLAPAFSEIAEILRNSAHTQD